MKEYKVMPYSVKHAKEDIYDIEYSETRYRIVDVNTGEILDDAQGYGYKTVAGAHRAWSYKNRTPEKKNKDVAEKAAVHKWCKENKSIIRDLSRFAFEIAKGSWGPDDKFDAKFVDEYMKENDITLPFSAKTLLKYM